jgi:DNA-binding CsgD family transcriptional regulator
MLLGRGRELARIRALLDGARGGTSGVLALVGEAGIGKSSVLDWAAENAEGMQVLRARGVQSEARLPFGGLFELLRPALDVLDQLPAPQMEALASALALRPARAHDRFAVGAATLGLLATYAEAEPVLVLVDDAQWIDGSSGDALRFALRRLVADPIAVLVGVREGAASFVEGAGIDALQLGGLDVEATGALLRRGVPGTSLETVERLHRTTGGNPLALLELAGREPSDAALAPPLRVAQAYLELAKDLPRATRRLLVLMASTDVGDVAVIERAAARLGLTLADVAAAEDVGLVEIRGGAVQFRHPLTRSAIYGAATSEERRSAHRALADSLPDREADRRAWHLALAATGIDDAASSALEQAGVRARERSAYDVGSHAFERAASLTADDDRRAFLAFAAADAAWLAGLADRALALLDDAAARDTSPPLRNEIDHLRGQIALRRGPVAEARAILRGAAERAQSPVLFAEAAEAAFFAGDANDMRACGERAAELAGAEGNDRELFFARMSAGMARLLVGEAAGADLIRDAVAILERSDELERDPRLLGWAAMGPLWLREAGVGDAVVERALAAARSHSAAGVLPHLLWHVAIGAAAGDDFVEAHATFDETIRLARETGQSVMLCASLARLALIDARCGRDAIARERAEEALALARELGAHLFEIWALGSLGELELARGDAGRSIAHYEELQSVLERRGISDADLSPAPERVELYLRTGRRADALPIAASFHAAAAAKGQPWALARATRALALVAPDDGFDEEFDRALELHGRTPDAFETARTRLAYGARLRRGGLRVRAREQLRAAHSAFEQLGAAPWADIARTELAGTGETARRRLPATLDDLTPQELKIALLLAQGKTTREAASALFLSPKTIEYHLRNAYRKLDVRSRDELATAVAARQ